MVEREKKLILVVEDEKHIAEGLEMNLKLQGYDAVIAPDGGAALQRWKSERPDLIVLDLMLPVIDGISVLRSIRLEDERIPILVLSAKGAPADKVKALSYGVDDYIAKPFDLEEFLLRVDRLLTRVSWNRSDADQDRPETGGLPNVYTFGDNRIDFATATASGPTGTVRLTEQEVRILKLFVSNRGKPLSRAKLLEIGWGYSRNTHSRTIDNFIVRFRKYFENDPKNPVYFKSLRSVGYIFEDGKSE
jgi:DNA-binding response OmpR family regulator